MTDFKEVLRQIAARHELTRDEMRGAMTTIMNGEATQAQLGAFLMGMRLKGETVGEIAAAVSILREMMVPVEAPDDAMDIVGTGGDGAGTLNISTAAAIVVASTGQPVAKHGNRALSSKSGAAEVLQSLGVKLDLAPRQITRCIREAGIGFMFAPAHHPAMRHVGPARMELGSRTLFNLLGPQSNPAGVSRFMMGVYAREWVVPVAEALLENGCESAWVVHGSDGLDELTTTGPSHVAQVRDGEVTTFEIRPEDFGIARSRPADLKGRDPDHNAARMRSLFDGTASAYRDIVVLNAAAALVAAGRAVNLRIGMEVAARHIDNGLARETLKKLVAWSNEPWVDRESDSGGDAGEQDGAGLAPAAPSDP